MSLLILAASGCAKRVTPVAVPNAEEQAKVEKTIQDELTRRDSINSFRGLYRVVQVSPDGRALFRYSLLMQRPDSLRLDVFPSTGTYTFGLFLAHNGEALALDPANQRAMKSQNSTRVIRTLLSLPLSAEELAGVALGTLPRNVSRESLTIGKSINGVKVSAQDGQLNWQFSSDGKQIDSVEVRRTAKGSVRASVNYQKYRIEAGASLPEVISLEIPDEDVRLDLTLVNGSINQEIAPEKFVVEVPEEYTVWEGMRGEDY